MGTRFDGQAEQFDQCAGMPLEIRRVIAESVVTFAECPREGLLLEVGAGTGLLGEHLQMAWPRYLGFDVSDGMLRIFRRRLTSGWPRAQLIQADAADRWPADDQSVSIIFSSRTLHLLDARHVAAEAARVATRQGAVLVVGRVQRDPDSIKSQMRTRMRGLLRDQGHSGRDGDLHRQTLWRRCRGLGWRQPRGRQVASWEVEHSPQASIDAWRRQEGLAGTTLPDATKEEILDRLQRWALERYGNLNRPCLQRETYVLDGIQVVPNGGD